MLVADALAARRSCRDYQDTPLARGDLNAMLWAAAGLTGEEGRRTAPSAHALYPTRIQVVAGAVVGLPAGLYHHADGGDQLTLLNPGDKRADLCAAALDEQPWIARAPAIIAIAADFDAAREAFKDQPPAGIRGERYVWLEAGAMSQSMYLQATALGLGGVLVAGFDDGRTAAALGLQDPWQPVALFCVGRPADTE